MNKEFFKSLLECPSVSGHEEMIQGKVKQYMSDVVDEFKIDNSGSLTSIINKESGFKVLLCGHIDEIGFYVNRIYPDGTIGVVKSGGVRPVLYLGTHVQIIGDTIVDGVVMTNSSIESKEKVVCSDLRIDIGCDCKEEAEKLVSTGSSVCASTSWKELQNERIAARAIDDRGGAFIILEAVRRAKEKGCNIGMYATTTTGEETTRRGAFHAATNHKPDCAIIVDVTFATDYLGARDGENGDVSLGKGAVLCHSSTVNKNMNQKMEEIAKQHQISYQWEVYPSFTYTDGDTVFLSNQGVPVCLVSLPLRYMHSSIEMADYKDIEACIELISNFLCEINENTKFTPVL